jgi:hypothetical protein
MLRIGLAALVAGAVLLGGPRAPAHAADISDNPECQRQFRELADPVFQQMLWYANVYNQYPIGPDGRPPVYSWPSSAYGPLNGYGPGSPYGPAFGLWGFGSFGPGFGGPGGYGIGPNSIGGPAWLFGRNQFANSVAALNAAPPGLNFLSGATTANNLNPGFAGLGALGAPGTGDLLTLAGLQQGEIGNALGGASLLQAVQANRIAEAGLRQAVFANRVAAAAFNQDRTDYPLRRANDLYQVIAGIQAYVSATCPNASDNGV